MKFQSLFSYAITAVTAFSLPTIVLAQSQTYLNQKTNVTQLSGEFVKMRDDDELLLNTSKGQVVVEAESDLLQAINLTVGEQITVSGRYDDNEFEGYTLIRGNGESFDIRD